MKTREQRRRDLEEAALARVHAEHYDLHYREMYDPLADGLVEALEAHGIAAKAEGRITLVGDGLAPVLPRTPPSEPVARVVVTLTGMGADRLARLLAQHPDDPKAD